MPSVTHVDATDLVSWASRRSAQETLPRLLRRLVHATVDRPVRVGFRAGEGVQLEGWDGVVAVEEGNAFVPSGVSTWEFGTNKDVRGKADSDYAKRCQDPRGIDPAQSTFVFVTPRRWKGKDEWVNARQREGIWREVRAYDADDLEAWLESAPAVHVWFSILAGKHPENTVDLGTFWADWAATTTPPMTPELVLSGRGDVAERVRAWLQEPAAPLALQAESREEALAVFAATVWQLSPDERVAHLSRAVVVRDLSAWNRLTASDMPLTMIPAFDSRAAIARATRSGHRVVIPLGRSDSPSVTTLDVPRMSRDAAEKALVTMGIAEERARELATLARRSFTSFRRRLAVSPEVQQPEWARPSEARTLLPAMLAGAWRDSKEGDHRVVTAVAAEPYEEVSRIFVRWSNESDPPVRRVGDAWFIVSREDAWTLLARYLTRNDLERFQQIAIDVLGTPDPRFDLPEEKRWLAAAIGKDAVHSGLLREGLAETLAVMGALGATVALDAGVSARHYATRVVRQLLERANADWRVWASLARVLPLLAEAAPDAFLAAVEEGLSGERAILRLFTDEGNPLFGSSPHTGLLWALETLAWSPEHLGHAALVLAKLARLDPGGKLKNRPQESLRGIFLLWHPQTAATLDQRLHVLDALRGRERDAAWRLLKQLLPENHGIGYNAPRPRFREWAPDSSVRVTRGEYFKGVTEIVVRMLADVGESGTRWRDLIRALGTLPPRQHDAVVERLDHMDASRLQPSDRADIWDALRQILAHHRSFPDAEWVLPQERLDSLGTLHSRFEPKEPAHRFAWLFTDAPDLFEGRREDWQAQQNAVASARLAAACAVHAAYGLEGIRDFSRRVARPDELGATLGRSELLAGDEDDLLGKLLGSDDVVLAHFARGFAGSRVWKLGREWAETKLIGVAKAWSPRQRAELLGCLPLDQRTWNLAASLGPESEAQYWRFVRPLGIQDDLEFAARKLLENGRPYTLITLLSFGEAHKGVPAPTLIVEALEAALRTPPDNDPPMGSFSYHVSRLLDVIEKSEMIDEKRLAALEWALLPLLEQHARPPRLLHRELARNPDFFAEIIRLVFRVDGDEPREPSNDEQIRARRGDQLLDSWRTVPGYTGDDIDTDALSDWVQRARAATKASGRGPAGDEKIGEVLSGSPIGTDGAWPHPAVRRVIEESESSDLERGIEIGVYNGRGVVTKHPLEGGVQEHQLAERYAGFALVVGDRWPRTAAMLRRLSEGYRVDARREDQEAELREDLGR